MTASLPQRVLCWYGDDFTGSTDVLESLSPYMPAVLFLERPDDAFFARFSDYAAFGLAGSSRSQSPAWMDEHLPSAFEWLRGLGARACHYKVCSTFDSSPTVGNIARAALIGKKIFSGGFVPVIAGSPPLRRFTAFGHLFAGAGDQIHRIDRHPTMKNHPVTPMREADLRLHLREQAEIDVELMSLVDLESPRMDELYRAKVGGKPDLVLIDVMGQASLQKAGQLLWEIEPQPFIVGSSGVEYSLLAYWRETGLLAGRRPAVSAGKADRVVVLSGSCSVETERQIQTAGQNGFELVRLDVQGLASGARAAQAADAAHHSAQTALSEGRSVVLFTAAGPGDRVASSNGADARFRHALSEQAGRILSRVLDESGVTRVIIAGGDTSSHAGKQLGIDALTFLSHVAPGAPLCKAWSRQASRNDLEIVFKGGQCGRPDFFSTVQDGRNET